MTHRLLPLLALLLASPVLAGTSPIPLSNPSFEADRNPSGNGSFGSGDLQDLGLTAPTGWAVIATDNTGAANNGQEIAFGWLNLTVADPASGPPTPQALSLMAGAVIGQNTSQSWSGLSEGDTLTLIIATGDRAANVATNGTPRFADDSFLGLSNGLAVKSDSAGGAASSWLSNVVVSTTVTEPPTLYKSGTMSDVVLTHTVTAADLLRPGNVGVFIASVGTRDGTGTGTGANSNQSFWDHVRLEVTSARPSISYFTASPANIGAGGTSTLAWEAMDATSVSISNGVGAVSPSGSVEVSPITNTTYILTATNPSGSATRSVTVGIIPPGPYRYYRFVPTALRNTAAANSVQLAEFQLLENGARIAGATASAPGGNSPGGETPNEGNDNNLDTKWLDFAKFTPLVLDFGAPVNAQGYRIATANDGDDRDPVSWRVEASHNGTVWITLDERTNAAVPTARKTYLEEMPLPSFSGPRITFTADPSSFYSGDSTSLTWSVTGADAGTVSINNGIGTVAASGSQSVTPAVTTTYTISATGSGSTVSRSVTVTVQPFPLPGITFTASPRAMLPGGTSTLSWNVTNATSVGINQGVGTVGTTGSTEVSPAATTTYTLTATGRGGTSNASATLTIATGGLNGNTFDTQFGETLLNPIANLIAAAPDATFLQIEDLHYNDGTMRNLLPGLTSDSSFSVLWTGWFNVTVDGPGDYTFGTESDDGSVVYLDLNGDGDFDDAGELIVDNNNDHPSQTRTGTASLTQDHLRIAIAFYENGGGDVMRARFKKGSGLGFSALSPVNGLTNHFLPTEPATGLPNISFFAAPASMEPGGTSTLTWNVSNATSVSIDRGIGNVAPSGSVEISPATSTTYTLTAIGTGGTRTRAVTVTIVPPGSFRWFRFVPTALRDEPSADSVQIAEYQMLLHGNRVAGAIASNPGGDSPGGESPAQGNDNDLVSKWLDFTKFTPLVLDFQQPVLVNGYRIATANDATERDPVGWRIEGSTDGTNWQILDTKTAYATPAQRSTYTENFGLNIGPPLALPFSITAYALSADRSQMTLTWQSVAGASYRIHRSTSLSTGTWPTLATGVASQGSTTTRTVPTGGGGRQFFTVERE